MTQKIYRLRTYFSTLDEATASNYVLREGEFWTEKDATTGNSTGRRKVGDGVTEFVDLPFEPSAATSTAVSVDFTPAGTIAATDVQAAIEELDNDARMSNPRTPTAHAASHGDGGADEITVSQDQVTGLAGALADKADTSALGTAAFTAATAYAPASQGVTNGNSHDHSGGDGAQIAYGSLSGLPPLGDSASRNVGTGAGTVAAGNDSRFHDSVTLGAALTPIFALIGQSLGAVDHGADRLLFWDDSAGALAPLTLGTNLSITGTTINASGGGGGNVSASGTPSAGQAAEWTSATEIQGVSFTGTGSYVKADGAQLALPRFSTEAAITAGTNAQGQAPLTADINVVTTAASNPSGVTLPAAVPERVVTIFNRGANNINVYPASGGTIDSRAINTADLIRVGYSRTYFAASSTQWYSSAEQTALNTIAGLGAGVNTFLATPNSSSLRGAMTDETGTGLLYFQGGDAGTPSAINLANGTGLPAAGVTGLGSLATLSALGSITSAGAIGSTANLPIITTTGGALSAGSFGTTAGTFAEGNDSRITGALSSSTAASTYQPLDSDLTSIAALTTTTYGRSQLTLAGAAADTAQLNVFSSSLKGLAPASGGGTNKTLQSDGTWAARPIRICIAVSDETTALTTGTNKVRFRMPQAITLTAVRAAVNTAPTGSTLVVDINEGDTPVSVLSTKLSIDATEKTSTTAASAAVISDTALANDAEISIDIDQVGATVAGAGLKVWLIGTEA